MLRLEGPPAPRGDDRSLDDLLSFIDGAGSGGTTKGSAKKKRSKGTRKQQPLATAAATNGHQQVRGLAARRTTQPLWLLM